MRPLLSLRNVLGQWQRKRHAHQHQKLQAFEEPACHAPYRISEYERTLIEAKRQGVVFPHVTAPGWHYQPHVRAIRPRLFLRHDVDTAACLRKLPMLLAINRMLGVPCGVYIRVDGEAYDPAEVAPMISAYQSELIEFGLHTTCYVHDDYLATFRRETDMLAAIIGHPPRSFTVHGLGPVRLDIRRRFVAHIKDQLADYGYEFSDCDSSLRYYDHVIQDCHWDEARSQRYLRDDFWAMRRQLVKGHVYLLLTHPCYWKP